MNLQVTLADEMDIMKSPKDGEGPGGNAYGYSTGYRLLMAALESAGVELVSDDPIWLHYGPPHTFCPAKGRVNVLFSMWEGETIPKDIMGAFNEADYLIVPTNASLSALKSSGAKQKIFVCRHAIDTDFFTPIDRRGLRLFGGVFRFLWVGAPNVRKGFDVLNKAFCDAFIIPKISDVELYMKSSLFGREGQITPMPQFNTVVDTRNFSKEVLRDLYWNSHAFVFPSRGEGVGLPLLEAMATGMPVIAPDYGAMADYIRPEHAYIPKWTRRLVEYGELTYMCEVLVSDLSDMMRRVVSEYSEKAVEKGLKAAEFVRDRFTIPPMGERLVKILKNIKEREDGKT
jgi:glycosyltransferase involved in cell wall biosynthesis